jgi:hypothetical protein
MQGAQIRFQLNSMTKRNAAKNFDKGGEAGWRRHCRRAHTRLGGLALDSLTAEIHTSGSVDKGWVSHRGYHSAVPRAAIQIQRDPCTCLLQSLRATLLQQRFMTQTSRRACTVLRNAAAVADNSS